MFRHADPARTAAAGNAADAGPRRGHYDIASDAYSQNVFHDLSNGFGVLEPSGRWLDKLGTFQEVLEKSHALASEPGILTDKAPLRDAAAHDFRPAPGSPALNHGVKVFVPWSLYGEVAEWNFYRDPGDPTHLIDEHWNMAPYYVERDGYYTRPTYPLKAVNASAADYERGPLESWTDGRASMDATSTPFSRTRTSTARWIPGRQLPSTRLGDRHLSARRSAGVARSSSCCTM